ncbi:MAG: beta-N-acetylhexosaminidase [Steroidobacteraceae bacterium]
MRRSWMGSLAGTVLLAAGVAVSKEPSLIPWPAQVALLPGVFVVDGQTPICATGAASKVGKRLQATIKAVQGLDLQARSCERAGITLVVSSAAAIADSEGYTLDVGADGIRIIARAEAGLYYGAMTAAQLLSAGAAEGPKLRLRRMHIEDLPRFKWRGLMLDPARHFLPVADVKTVIEQMGQHKLNVLHLHLTDDQGWRIEIKRYPKLTQIGAWRKPPSNGGPGSETAVYGGFYTQEDIRDIVAYAAERYVTIVPEIDLPGHAQAVVAAYPQLGVAGDQPAVSNDWGVNYCLYSTSADGLAFVKNVLDELLPLFPGKYVHLGGDEAVKDQWKASAAIQAQMKTLGLADEDALQSWFMEQIGTYLTEHGRTMVGWDEILQGGVPSSATVMSWRGIQGAITAARLDHDVVLSPAPTLYFDNLQSRREDEPAGRLAIAPLSQVYNFEVMPAVLSPDEGRHVLGAQANFWSEYLLSGWYLQHAAFPRVDALSEAVWTAPSHMSWAGFLSRLPAQLQRYRRQGIAAADSAFAVDFQVVNGRNAALRSGAGAVMLFNQTAFGKIHYTLDGSEPNLRAKLYATPLALTPGVVIKATAFSDDGLPLTTARSYEFSPATLLARSSNQLEACPGGNLGLRLPLTPNSPAVAPVYDVDLYQSCYIYPKALLSGVAALQFDVARLPRNFALANHKNQLKSYPAQTRFGELVVYQDRCETGPELARAALPDPVTSDARQSFQTAIVPTPAEHDLCLIFTAPTSGPLYVIGAVKLVP